MKGQNSEVVKGIQRIFNVLSTMYRDSDENSNSYSDLEDIPDATMKAYPEAEDRAIIAEVARLLKQIKACDTRRKNISMSKNPSNDDKLPNERASGRRNIVFTDKSRDSNEKCL